MNKQLKKSRLTKLMMIATMSVVVVFTASACNNDTDVNNNGNSNVIEDGVNNTPDVTEDQVENDDVTTP